MTLTITLAAAVEKRLAEQAAKDGKTVEALAGELIEKAVTPEKRKSFEEIAAPFSKSLEVSGMCEEELDALVEEARQEVWEEKQRANK